MDNSVWQHCKNLRVRTTVGTFHSSRPPLNWECHPPATRKKLQKFYLWGVRVRCSGRSAVSRHGVESDISCQGVRFSVSDQTLGISRSSPTLLVHDHSREILRLGRRILPSRYSLGLSFFFFFFLLREIRYVFTGIFSGIVDFSTAG